MPALMQLLKANNIRMAPTEAVSRRWFSPLRSAEALARNPALVFMDKETISTWINAKKNL
jgi:hypothetical protein